MFRHSFAHESAVAGALKAALVSFVDALFAGAAAAAALPDGARS